jgi:hypothetical protein
VNLSASLNDLEERKFLDLPGIEIRHLGRYTVAIPTTPSLQIIWEHKINYTLNIHCTDNTLHLKRGVHKQQNDRDTRAHIALVIVSSILVVTVPYSNFLRILSKSGCSWESAVMAT